MSYRILTLLYSQSALTFLLFILQNHQFSETEGGDGREWKNNSKSDSGEEVREGRIIFYSATK